MKHIIAILFLSLFAGIAGAQTSPQIDATASVSWVLPTKTTDGQALTGADALTRVLVYADTSIIADSSTADPVATLPGTATSYEYKATVPNGSTLYFRIRAGTAAALSAFSNQATKAVRIGIPNVPTGVSVTVLVTVSTVTQ